MAEIKTIVVGAETGKVVYTIVCRNSDSFLLDDADGSFSAAPADPYISLTEHGTIKGLYTLAESRTAWADGSYLVVVYLATAAPNPVNDFVLGVCIVTLSSDHISSGSENVLDSTLGDHTINGSTGLLFNKLQSHVGVYV
jgi:hypothetical protein